MIGTTMERKHIASFTEQTKENFPAYVSINRENDGSYVITARERGHGGNKTVTITIPASALYVFASNIITEMG